MRPSVRIAVVVTVLAAGRVASAQRDDRPAPARAPTVAPAAAAPSVELALPDILAAATRTSPALEGARLRVLSARGQALVAESTEDLRLTARSATTRGTGSGPTAPLSWTNTLGLSRLLPTGGTLSVDAEIGLDRRIGHRSAVTVSAAHPLLRGAGPAAARAAINAARATRDAASLRREAAARNVVRDVVAAYWAVAVAEQQLAVRQSSLELARKQLSTTQAMVRASKLAQSDIAAVEQVIAIREQDLLSAELEVWERSLDLRRLAGLEISADAIVVHTAPLPAITGDDPALAATVSRALERSAELAALRADLRAAAASATAARSGRLPQLDLSVGATAEGVGGSHGDALTSLRAGDAVTIDGALTLSHAFARSLERGADQVARSQLLAAKLAVRDAEAALVGDAARAVQQVKIARNRVTIGLRAIEFAQANVEAEQRRFDFGRTTIFEVLRRQEDLQAARLRHAQAVFDFLSTMANLDALTGDILDRYGLTVE